MAALKYHNPNTVVDWNFKVRVSSNAQVIKYVLWAFRACDFNTVAPL